jgi:uncharacterized membrane protein YbhN (UPF0104 family)
MKRRVLFVLKVAAAAGGFGYLLLTGRLSTAPLKAAFANPFTIGGMIALQVILLILGVFRWWLLLRTVDNRLHSYRSLLAFNWIGQFFGCFAPSSITTDATRMAYVRSSGEATTPVVLTSLVIDRVCGITGALLLTVVMARELFFRFVGSSEALIGTMAILIVVLTVVAWRSPRGALVRERVPTVTVCIGISVVAHALKVVCLWLAAHRVVDLETLFTFAPVGFLAEALPIAPGGFGTAHLAFEYLFGVQRLRGGAALFNVYFAVRLLVSAFGGVVWVAGWRRLPRMAYDPA